MKTTLIGRSIIAGVPSDHQGIVQFRSIKPSTGETWGPVYFTATTQDINDACGAAQKAFLTYRRMPQMVRATLLKIIAEAITAKRDDIIEACLNETGYGAPRVEGEFNRLVGQLRFFAQVIEDGLCFGSTIDHPDPNPGPGAVDIRSHYIGKGPVVVFAASNFPLAFSVCGGDTVAALAAGCPVIVKAHRSHPVTSELVAGCIVEALAAVGLPPGLFSLIQGQDHTLNIGLVQHPLVKAVGFTGSRKGGTALIAAAQSRREPIPVYAEMSAVGPNFLAESALNAATAKLLFDSNVLGAGQFCTNPGILFVPHGPAAQSFVVELTKLYSPTKPLVMLSADIAGAYARGVEELVKAGASILASGEGDAGNNCAVPTLLHTTSTSFSHRAALHQEVFGPAMLVVVCDSTAEMNSLAHGLEGQLVAVLWGNNDELNSPDFVELRDTLELKAGRIVENAVPTGVRVCYSQVHGGPFPASTADTSVGAASINRFQRLIALQGVGSERLPLNLRDDDRPYPTRVDGRLVLRTIPPAKS